MDGKSVNRSINQRKTSYFEKYRLQLDKITDEMKKSDKLIKSVNISQPEIKQQKQIPVTFRKITIQSKLSTPNETEPLKISIKKLTTKKQQDKSKLVPDSIQDLQKIKKQMEGIKQVQQLVAEIQVYKTKNQKADFELEERKKIIQGLKKRLSSSVSEKQYMNNVVNYAERILLIEQKMKVKKQNHQQELNKLFIQKKQKHSQNVQLSKQIQKQEDEIATLSKTIQNAQSQSPTKNLQAISNRLRAQIAKLQNQYEIALKKENSKQQLKEMSYRQYKKYVQIFTKQFLGRQIALSQDRIKMRNDNKRYLLQIQKKKIQLKQKKIQLMIRKKGLIEMHRIIQRINKEIKQIQGEQKVVHQSDRKMSFFQKL